MFADLAEVVRLKTIAKQRKTHVPHVIQVIKNIIKSRIKIDKGFKSFVRPHKHSALCGCHTCHGQSICLRGRRSCDAADFQIGSRWLRHEKTFKGNGIIIIHNTVL